MLFRSSRSRLRARGSSEFGCLQSKKAGKNSRVYRRQGKRELVSNASFERLVAHALHFSRVCGCGPAEQNSARITIQTTFRRITYHTRREKVLTGCPCMLHCCAFKLTSSPYRPMARAYNPSRLQDRPFCLQLHSSVKFDAVTSCARRRETCLLVLHSFQDLPNQQPRRGRL